MRILQVNKFLYPKGGSETYMFGLSDSLKELGYEIEYWGMKDDRNIINDTYNSFVENVEFNSLKGGEQIKQTLNTIYSFESKKKIKVVLDNFKPDIVHIHNFNFQLTPSILPEIKKRGIKIVYTAHDSQFACPYHRLYNFERDETCIKCIEGKFYNCIKDKCFNGSFFKSVVGSMESYFYHGLDYYNKYIDVVISPSRFLADILKKMYKKDIIVNHNFIKLDKSERVGKEDFILYFGRISREKGIIDILPFFEENRIKLIIIGSGPEESKIISSKYVNFIGPKFGDELFKYIRKAKYVIQPSKWFENCPMTIIESFACGTPVIGAKHSGFIELINDGINGFLIDFNTNDWQNDMLRCIHNYEDTLSENAEKSYENKYTKEVHIPKVINVYNNLINESI